MKNEDKNLNEASYSDIMNKISNTEYKKLINSDEFKTAYDEYLEGEKKPSLKEREAAKRWAVQQSYSILFESEKMLNNIQQEIDDLEESLEMYDEGSPEYNKIEKELDKLIEKKSKILFSMNENDTKMEKKSTWEIIKESVVNEGHRIPVKRKYTEQYPTKYVGYDARVRNEVVKYLGANQVMTEDEFEDVLNKCAKHPKLWKERNKSIYRKDENGYIKLTEKGKRILNGIDNLEKPVNESENINEGVWSDFEMIEIANDIKNELGVKFNDMTLDSWLYDFAEENDITEDISVQQRNEILDILKNS